MGGLNRGRFFPCVTGPRLDLAENLAAALDFDLAVEDRSRDPAGRPDQQPVVNDEITFEAAAYLSLGDGGGTLEETALGNLDDAAVGWLGVDAALDEQLVAGSDFTRQGDTAADAEAAAPIVGFLWIGQIGEPAQRLAGPRRHRHRPGCANGFDQKAAVVGGIWHLRIL